jgi:two-component system, OmpR family, sensor histidine kinase ChvG
MSLRLKLLLLSLLTLTLPLAGYRYALDVEELLRGSEQDSLAAMAQTVAASLQGRDDMLYRSATGEQFPPPERFDLIPIPLRGTPFIDGYVDEWPDASGAWKYFNQGDDRLGILTGVHERMLFVQLDIRDNQVVFDAPNGDPLDPAAFGDRVWIGFEDASGAERQVFLAATGPGAVPARRIEAREYNRQFAVEEPRITAAWQLTFDPNSRAGGLTSYDRPAQGYRIELRIPLSLLGSRFGVLIDDRDQRGAMSSSYGTLRGDDLHTQGRLIAAAPELARYLAQFLRPDQPGLRLSVLTPDGSQLAMADNLDIPSASGYYNEGRSSFLTLLYRRLLDRPEDRQTLEAPASIQDRDQQKVLGTVLVTQSPDRWLAIRDRAVTKLLNFTLITSAIVVLGMFAFAARLGTRLHRLRRASESALTREGLVTTFPESQSPDELGDVSRSFSTLMHRLNEYTGYLRTLAGKLAHEIRTPIAIVRSSLDNIETEGGFPASARPYLDRARQGTDRLNAMLVAMNAATRVEEAIQSAERTRFDLVPVIESAVAGYRSAFPERRFADIVPGSPMEIEGAPDLIVQLLDKLVDNAVDFSPAGATITVRLRFESHHAVLEVENPGPPLPADAPGRLFESLWQSRAGRDAAGGKDARPHFGLGLYIVKLIAEFHGGHASAEDLPDASGARFSVWLKV